MEFDVTKRVLYMYIPLDEVAFFNTLTGLPTMDSVC